MIIEQQRSSNEVRIYLTPKQHGTIFLNHGGNPRGWNNSSICGMAYEAPFDTQYSSPPFYFKPSLFYIKRTEVGFLNAVIAYSWADTVYLNRTYYDTLGKLTHADTAFVAPEVTMKLYYKNMMLDTLYPKSKITEPFDRDTFRAVFNELYEHLEELTEDHEPYQVFKYLADTICFKHRSYVDIMGEWKFESQNGCIQASLSCLPTEQLFNYQRRSYIGKWVWEEQEETYWLDTTVWNQDLFMAKYGRKRSLNDEDIYDIDWDDLAISLKVKVGVDHRNKVVEGFTDVEGYEDPFFYYGCRDELHDLGREDLSRNK